MNKWLTAEQWLNIIKSLHDFERKEEELDTQTLNIILGKNDGLKRVIDVHSNLNKSGMFRHRRRINKRRHVFYYCTNSRNAPTMFNVPNTHVI